MTTYTANARIEERVTEIAKYIIESRCTVRQAATKFHVSKSTVHKDVTERLPHIRTDMSKEIRQVLDCNKAERHIRGGLATQKKYSHLH